MKFIEKKIATLKSAVVYNFFLAVFFWGSVGFVIYHFFWLKSLSVFGTDYFYLFLGIVCLLLMFIFLSLNQYKNKYIPIFSFVITPFILYCLFFYFVILWNNSRFIGPSF
jgi:hypothetical protein